MKALFSAATGMAAQQIQIDTIANNLANVSTNGFKKTRVAFEDLVYENIRTGEASADSKRPGQLEIGSGSRVIATQRDFTPGSISQTNAPLDVAIQGRWGLVPAKTVEDEGVSSPWRPTCRRHGVDGALPRASEGEETVLVDDLGGCTVDLVDADTVGGTRD